MLSRHSPAGLGMAQYYAKIDDTNGRLKRVPVLYTDTLTVVSSGGGEVDFAVSGLTASNLVESWVNGMPQVEGDDFARNVAQNKITYTETQPQNAVIKIRVWS